ncbi:MAG: hypothetical protein WCC17_20020 [Candidatus Nitrosopolaris sp.]
MISTKQRTIALSAIAIAATIALFASAPLVAAYQAYVFRGHGFGGFGWGGWGGYDGGWGSNRCAWFGCGVGSGGWFPWGPPTPSFAG